ncbi:AraC family transcriptional regulator [Enterococcus larvae]|uniref:AraC family transcriptional regulator n=1 Tax=Enterococcus larvae TaxID=2794352 RepID=UPI003F2AE234
MDYLIEHFHKKIDCYYNINVPKIKLHLHNHLELFLFIRGDVRYFIDGKAIELQPGHLLFINNNQIHGPKLLSDALYERISIHFSHKFAEMLSTEKTSLLKTFNERISLIKLSETQLLHMISLMKELTNEYNAPSPYGHDLEVSSLLIRILLYANRCAANSEEALLDSHLPELVKNMLIFIQENLSSSELSVDMLAQNFSHNGIYLNRIFKKELSSSIYHYILLSRISAAKKYLENGNDVLNTCYLSGFNDYSNFIRTFKKITTVTPKQYAKSFKEQR